MLEKALFSLEMFFLRTKTQGKITMFEKVKNNSLWGTVATQVKTMSYNEKKRKNTVGDSCKLNKNNHLSGGQLD
jgi:hypothetical protein